MPIISRAFWDIGIPSWLLQIERARNRPCNRSEQVNPGGSFWHRVAYILLDWAAPEVTVGNIRERMGLLIEGRGYRVLGVWRNDPMWSKVPDREIIVMITACSMPGCLRIVMSKRQGVCELHYTQASSPNRHTQSQATMRAKVIEALGGRCCRCGFDDPRALQVDHKDGGGSKHNRAVAWLKRYQAILADASPYQLLCANCNWIKRTEKREATGRPRWDAGLTG